MTKITRGVNFLQLWVRDEGMLAIRLWKSYIFYLKRDHGASNVIPNLIYPQQWHHLCLQVFVSSKTVMGVLVSTYSLRTSDCPQERERN